jgi:hypothetical protein
VHETDKNRERQLLLLERTARAQQRYPIFDQVVELLETSNLQTGAAVAEDYTPAALEIVPRLVACASVEEAHSLVYSVFCNLFAQNNSSDFDRYRPVAEQIFCLFLQSRQ